ncbi:MAG: hypothetical protein WCF18_01600 [Chthoniobacteraceae bacterium]
MDKIPTYPARPINGGPLEKARPKHGKWACEPKVNGWRALVHVPSGTMWNRHGEKLSIAGDFKTALAKLRELAIVLADCEALERRHNIGRGSLIVLDWISGAPYLERRAYLESALQGHVRPASHEPDSISLIPSFDADKATELYELLKTMNAEARCEFYEGIVMKRTTASYPNQLINPTRETTDWVKHRWHF